MNNQPILKEDFSTATGSTPPAGWTVEVLEGNPETDLWRFDNPGSRARLDLFSRFSGNFATYDSDFLSDDGINENITLKSPVFNASDSEKIYLLFDQYYDGISSGDTASRIYVETSTDGTNWEQVYFADSDRRGDTPVVDLSATVAGAESAEVRFRFEGNWSRYWGIDNIEIVDKPGIKEPTSSAQVGKDNIPDAFSLAYVLKSQPTADVTLEFSTDGTKLQPIAPITFTPDNWFESQAPVVKALEDISEGTDDIDTSLVKVTVTSNDPNYAGLTLKDVTVEISDDIIPGFPSYRTVERTFADLAELATANSNIASWLDIGDSYDKITPGGSEGYDIYAIELTNKNNGIENKPTLYVQGGLHAREYTPVEVVTRFAEELVGGYGQNADMTWLLDYFKIAIVPIANPDARKFAEQKIRWRKNTNPNAPEGIEPAEFPNYGVDLNRNFGFKWGERGSSSDPSSSTYRGAEAFSEPETQVVRDYATKLFPDQRGPGDFDPAPSDTTGIFLDVHSQGNEVLLPYGWTDLPAPNRKALETLGRKFSYYTSTEGEAFDVKKSSTSGSARDWAYGTLGIAGYTIELGNEHFQDVEYFEETIVPQVIPSLIYSAKAAYRPYQQPFGPETIEVSTDLTRIVAGTETVLNVTADDTRYNDGEISTEDSVDEPVQNIAQARYSIDSPSWIEGTEFFSLESVDGELDSSIKQLTATIDTSNLESGRHTIFVESQDANGNFGVPTAVFIDVIDFDSDAEMIKGGDGAELIEGSTGAEVIYALDGDDTVAGGLGDDLIFGNAGNDLLRGDLNDALPTGEDGGNDLIYGGDGNDFIDGKGGDDTLYGDAGEDYIVGNSGNDIICGGDGNDTLAGDDLYFSQGNDTFMIASQGTDVILDFAVEDDLIELPTDISFAQLSITQDRQDTLIDLDDSTLVVLRDVEAKTITESSFVSV